MRPEEYTRGITEIRARLAGALPRSLKRFMKSDRLRLEEAISLLATDQTIHPQTLDRLREFYDMGDEQKRAFFTALGLLDFKKVHFVLNQIHAALDSPEWLIRLRADLFALLKKLKAGGPKGKGLAALQQLSDAFTYHFMQIFNYQYLVTRCCDAQNTSIALLKFISKKEGVHPTKNWWNFENRLNSPDHIILTLEHFKMPYIPLVYIEIALSNKLIKKIDRILGEKRSVVDVASANTAIFYSLNTTLAGMNRIGLGGKMILAAKKYIAANYPQVTRFATLSPVPRFRKYLDAVLAGGEHRFSLTTGKINANRKGRFFREVDLRAARVELAGREPDSSAKTNSELLARVLSAEDWFSNPVYRKAMRYPLIELARYYFEREKKPDRKTGKRSTAAYDPVENFHLSNGAYIGRINYLANRSERGMSESYGMMVNYIYDSRYLDGNKLLYGRGKVIIRA